MPLQHSRVFFPCSFFEKGIRGRARNIREWYSHCSQTSRVFSALLTCLETGTFWSADVPYRYIEGRKYALDHFGCPADSLAARTGNQLHPARFHSLASRHRPVPSDNSTSDWAGGPWRETFERRRGEIGQTGVLLKHSRVKAWHGLIDDFVGK